MLQHGGVHDLGVFLHSAVPGALAGEQRQGFGHYKGASSYID